MKTLKSFAGLIILIACCIIFKAPLFITIGLAGLSFFVNSYHVTKNGDIDNRYKFGCTSFILGLVLILISFIIYTSAS